MKIIIALLLGLVCFGFAGQRTQAQDRKITVILVRHAEKDPHDAGADPQLSPEGARRAARFARLVRKYKPRRIYTTDFQRTKQTAAPLALARNLKLEIYDPRRPDELVRQLLTFRKNRRVVIVGHSNSIPALANLLVKENKYQSLADTEYGKIWIIRLKKGKVSAELREY